LQALVFKGIPSGGVYRDPFLIKFDLSLMGRADLTVSV